MGEDEGGESGTVQATFNVPRNLLPFFESIIKQVVEEIPDDPSTYVQGTLQDRRDAVEYATFLQLGKQLISRDKKGVWEMVNPLCQISLHQVFGKSAEARPIVYRWIAFGKL